MSESLIVSLVTGLVPTLWDIFKYLREHHDTNFYDRIRNWVRSHRRRLLVYLLLAIAVFFVMLYRTAGYGLNRVDTEVSLLTIHDDTLLDGLFANRISLPITSNSQYVYVADTSVEGPVILTLEGESVKNITLLEDYYEISAIYADEPSVYVSAVRIKNQIAGESDDKIAEQVFIKIDPDGNYAEVSESYEIGMYINRKYTPVVTVTDFLISEDGTELWYVEKSEIESAFCIKKAIRASDRKDEWFERSNIDPVLIPNDVNLIETDTEPSIVMTSHKLFFSAPSKSCIFQMQDNALGYDDETLAGTEGNSAYNDKRMWPKLSPLFYSPGELLIHGGYLYILDDGVLRRISLENNSVCQTLAGRPEEKQEINLPGEGKPLRGDEVVFPAHEKMLLAADLTGSILISVASRGRVYRIKEM